MEVVDFIPVCGSMKNYRRRGTYHKLKRGTEVSDCNENVAMLGPNVKMVDEVIPKAQPKMRFCISLWKRFRDAYVQGMICLAEHVAHLNNIGEICFSKKITHDDDDHTSSLKLGF